MHDEPTPSSAEREDDLDGRVLSVLVSADDSHRPWSVEQIAREVRQDPRDSLSRLQREGLVHRLGDFAWPTRAAVRAEELKS
jgi:hypothetical protein